MKRIILVAFCLAVLGAGVWWLFRSTAEDNPAGGKRWLRRSFGRPSSLVVDSNSNGVIDAKLLFSLRTDDYYTGSGEYFEDRDEDGNFEVHARLINGKVIWVEVRNDNSEPRLLFGLEARSFLQSAGEK